MNAWGFRAYVARGQEPEVRDLILAEGAPVGAVRGHDLPFCTSRHIERPSRLEGSLKLAKRST